jgi:hypothetical protein
MLNSLKAQQALEAEERETYAVQIDGICLKNAFVNLATNLSLHPASSNIFITFNND